jgi:hypothetical protein
MRDCDACLIANVVPRAFIVRPAMDERTMGTTDRFDHSRVDVTDRTCDATHQRFPGKVPFTASRRIKL